MSFDLHYVVSVSLVVPYSTINWRESAFVCPLRFHVGVSDRVRRSIVDKITAVPRKVRVKTLILHLQIICRTSWKY